MSCGLRKKLRLFARDFIRSTRGSIDPSDAITMAISFFLAAVVLPIGIGEVYAANVTGWNASVKTIFQILFPILAIVGLAMYWIPKARKK